MADPGFDLGGGGRGLCQRGGGGGRKLLKVLKVEVKVILACFGHISIEIMLICLKLIASEASEEFF